MNWYAQVGHVAAKDVRQARWALVVYVALLSVAAAAVVTGRALGPYSTSSSSMTLGMPDVFVLWLPVVTIILGFISTALLVQADSPTRANAFWASRPLSPSAVLIAKLVVAATAIVALPVFAGLSALASLDASGAAMATLLARAALSYGELTLAVIVISTLTDDLRGFVGAFVAILVGIVVVGGALADFALNVPVFVPAALMVIGVGGGVLLVAYLYRTHDRRIHTWIVGVPVTVCLVIASFIPPIPHEGDVPIVSGGAMMELEPLDPSSWGQARQLSIKVRVAQGLDSARLDFQPDTVAFRLLDGKDVHLDGTYPAVVARGVLPPVGHPVRWIIDPANAEWSTAFAAEPLGLDRQSIARGVKSVAVGGTMTVSRSHVVASLPLRNGAAVTRDGRRVAIYGFSHDAAGADMWVQTSAIPRAGGVLEQNAQLRDKDGLQFALVNDARSEAMLIDNQSGGSGGSGSIVLPWIGISTEFKRLTTNLLRPSDALPRDEAWYAGARLVIVEWNVVGRYRSRGEATLP